jgi:thymidylate synthase
LQKIFIEVDGGSRGNPGPAACGAILREAPDGPPVWAGGWPIGQATNNVAEYSSLIRGLQEAVALGARQVQAQADSELMVKQVNGQYKVRNQGLKPLHSQVMELLKKISCWEVRHVKRDKNADADAQVNAALDTGVAVGNAALAGGQTGPTKTTGQESQPGRPLDGNIPVLCVEAEGLAEAWEKSLLALWQNGGRVSTEYDKKADGQSVDAPSLDCTMVMTVLNPASEPFIHRAFPGGLEDLEEYRQEVLFGIKDHWVRDPNDPADDRWEYTYHQRIFAYEVPGLKGKIDQLARSIDKLAASPFTRRAQAITWQPWFDLDCYDPACLQSIWLRVLPDAEDVWHLNMNIRFRSRDAYDAAFMNCFALISLQEHLAAQLAEKTGREVKLGRYTDMSDSYHIYGRRIEHFRQNFLTQVANRDFEDRTWDREFAEEFFVEARPGIKKKVAEVDAQRLKNK